PQVLRRGLQFDRDVRPLGSTISGTLGDGAAARGPTTGRCGRSRPAPERAPSAAAALGRGTLDFRSLRRRAPAPSDAPPQVGEGPRGLLSAHPFPAPVS